MTNIKTLEELGRIIFELSGLDNEYDRKILEQALNLYIEERERLARLDEIRNFAGYEDDDWNGIAQIPQKRFIERIKELEG